MDWKLELVMVPVSNVDRAKEFYVEKFGFNADHDQQVDENLRFVQLTPPGSACSIAIGTGITKAKPGSIDGLQIVVKSIEAAKAELESHGLTIGEVQNLDWGKFIFLKDPDGNSWAIQELPPRP
jgi:catechol 2,3-dioxygenase-like lactoylglutathione lyase family enzyme